MTALEIRKWDKDFERSELSEGVYSARALIEIAAQLSEMNQSKPDGRGPFVKMREQLAEEENSYVACLRFDRNDYDNTGATLELCDSDAEGAFKVYRRRM